MRARVLSLIAWALVSVWSRTIRLRVVNSAVPERLEAEGRNFVYAFWHGRQFLLFHHHRHRGVLIPASESRDGEIQAGVLRRFGFAVVRGSSKRKGERALLGLVDGLRKGKQVAIAVDGPRGPLHEVKQGVIYLAGKLNKPIVPVIASARRYWILEKIWDKLLLPRPFTTGVIMYGEPISVQDVSPEELERKRQRLEKELNALILKADSYFVDRA